MNISPAVTRQQVKKKSVNAAPNYLVPSVNRLLTNWILHPRFGFEHGLGRSVGSPARWSLGTALHCGTSGGLSWRDRTQGLDHSDNSASVTSTEKHTSTAHTFLHYLQHLPRVSWHFPSCRTKDNKWTFQIHTSLDVVQHHLVQVRQSFK